MLPLFLIPFTCCLALAVCMLQLAQKKATKIQNQMLNKSNKLPSSWEKCCCKIPRTLSRVAKLLTKVCKCINNTYATF